MLGIEDPWVATAYILCPLSALLCLLWGILKWNKGDDDTEPAEEIKQWVEEEARVEDEL